MGKNQNDCSIRVPCLRLLDESDWDNAEPESPDLDLWISLGCSRGHAKASRQRDDYGEEIRMITDRDARKIIERLKRLEERLQRLVDSPIGQEERK